VVIPGGGAAARGGSGPQGGAGHGSEPLRGSPLSSPRDDHGAVKRAAGPRRSVSEGPAAPCGPDPAPRKSDHGSLAIGGLPFPRRLVSTHSRSLFGPSTRRGAGRAGPGGRTRAPPPW